jgi:heme oxygenase
MSYEELEEALAKEKDLHSLTRNRFQEATSLIERLERDRDYWKLSFNKQVNATRSYDTVLEQT